MFEQFGKIVSAEVVYGRDGRSRVRLPAGPIHEPIEVFLTSGKQGLIMQSSIVQRAYQHMHPYVQMLE